MEKENINSEGSQNKNLNLSNIVVSEDGDFKVSSEEMINHNCSLEEVFKAHIRCGIASFKKERTMMAAAFLVFRDYEKKEWEVAIFPLPNTGPGAMQFHGKVLRKLIEELKKADTNDFKMEGLIMGMDSHMSYVEEGIIDEKGMLDKSKYVAPSQDPNSKDVLTFSLEDSFGKHFIAYEYIQTEEDVVISDKPIVDIKNPYDEREDKNSNFGFLFAEKTSQN